MSLPVRLTLIVAMGENGIIGDAGKMPWHLASDLKRFRVLTMGKPMIMGRKTYQSIGRPLDGRDTIIVTRQAEFTAPGTHVAASLADAIDKARELAAARGADEIMVIGGAQIYALALPLAGRIHLTRVHAAPKGDTSFPEFDPAEWRVLTREHQPAGERDDFDTTFTTLEREQN